MSHAPLVTRDLAHTLLEVRPVESSYRNFRRITCDWPMGAVVDVLHRDPSLWDADRYWKDHPRPVFRDVDTVYLRMVERAPYHFDSEDHRARWCAAHDQMEARDEPVYQRFDCVRPFVQRLMAAVHGERLGRILINRVGPGGGIPVHVDGEPGSKYYDRYHVVLSTNPQVEFRCGDELHAGMRPGDVWWIENYAPHSVKNNGNTPRIHMVIDIKTRTL